MDIKTKRALVRLFEAYVDLNSAKALLEKKIESRSLSHSQQCVEKALKACLAKVIVGDILSHTVAQYFEEKILPDLSEELKERFKDLHDIIWVEERWIDTRYEEFEAKRVKVPSLRFGSDDAKKGVKIAERVLFDCIDVVNHLFGQDFPKDFEKLKKLVKEEMKK